MNKNIIMLNRVKITTEVFFRATSELSSFIVEDVGRICPGIVAYFFQCGFFGFQLLIIFSRSVFTGFFLWNKLFNTTVLYP